MGALGEGALSMGDGPGDTEDERGTTNDGCPDMGMPDTSTHGCGFLSVLSVFSVLGGTENGAVFVRGAGNGAIF
ncbi:hypothetical protein GCM10017557_63770 [Streptomyces aurantiacus]|uniref:Uncharacterized protein n=1 Tax=Streptomyces aurantiacus TaxID=47760 RepID=A0A7G1P805_9ACTN|nr:hypothetical protein GCM10017557_63770 [Streptomyces aurantiacus]